jgi:hypothetical protein
MQLSIDMTIQPGFTQHPVQRALCSLWQARCRAGQISLWPSLPCHLLGPFLPDTFVLSLSDTNRCVIRIASAHVTQLLGDNCRGQTLDRLCAPAIKSRFERLVLQVFARQSPMSVTLLSQRLCQDAVLTVLPLLDRQRQCRRALVTLDSAGGQFCDEDVQHKAPFSELGPVYYARCPCPRPVELKPLVLCIGGKKGTQNPARPYRKLVG